MPSVIRPKPPCLQRTGRGCNALAELREADCRPVSPDEGERCRNTIAFGGFMCYSYGASKAGTRIILGAAACPPAARDEWVQPAESARATRRSACA